MDAGQSKRSQRHRTGPCAAGQDRGLAPPRQTLAARPSHWFVTLFPSPDIRINYGDPITGQTGRWFVPFDFRFGKKFTENIALSLAFGAPIVRDYPVYDFKTQLRLNVTW
jgi:hypothetical protein